jgi:hypothetical protein
VLYDMRGHIIGAAADATTPSIAREALRGNATSGARISDGALVLSGVAPVRAPTGRVIGAIEVIAPVDVPFVRDLAALTGADISVVTITGQSIDDANGAPPTMAELTADPAATEHPVPLTINGERYLSMVLPLRDSDGANLGLMYVGVEYDAIVMEQHAAQREVLTTTAIALSIGLAIAFALACCSRARSQRWSRPHDASRRTTCTAPSPASAPANCVNWARRWTRCASPSWRRART